MKKYIVADLKNNMLFDMEKVEMDFPENEQQTSSINCLNRIDLIEELKKIVAQLEEEENKKVCKEDILEYLENDSDLLLDLIRDVNSWDGYFSDMEYYENDEEFFEMFFCDKPMEAVRASYFGNYNYNDEYVQVNAYGNLDSCDKYDLDQQALERVEEIFDYWYDLYDNNKVQCYYDEFTEMLENWVEEDED